MSTSDQQLRALKDAQEMIAQLAQEIGVDNAIMVMQFAGIVSEALGKMPIEILPHSVMAVRKVLDNAEKFTEES